MATTVTFIVKYFHDTFFNLISFTNQCLIEIVNSYSP